MSAIRPKQKKENTKEFDERARRYIFSPLHPLDFAGTQATSPIWCPKVPKGRLVLLEELSYWASGDDGRQGDELFAVGAGLIEQTMGTLAQVTFIKSEFGNRGVIEVQCLVDVDPATAEEIDEMLFSAPYGNLYELRSRLEAFRPSKEDPVQDLAAQVAEEVLRGVAKAIGWATNYCNELEREVQEGRAGRRGRTKVDNVDKFFYKAINRQSPKDADLPFQTKPGGEIATLTEALSKLIPQDSEGLDELRRTNEFLLEQQKVMMAKLSELTAEPEEGEKKKK